MMQLAEYTPQDILQIQENPHVLGWLIGRDKLGPIHSKWIHYIWDPDGIPRKALQAFRGSYKSTALDLIGPIYYLLFYDPDARIFIIRKSFTDAAEILETIMQAMETPEIVSLFEYVHGSTPKCRIKRKEKVTFNFKTSMTPEGSLNAFGIDSNFTGKHGDFFLLDDVVTRKDRFSRAEREKTKDVIREIATNVVDPGKPVRFIGTPWHKEDAWESTREGEYRMIPVPLRYPYTHPEVSWILTPQQLEEKRRTTNGPLWAANYELTHVASDEALFSDPQWADWKHTGIDMVRGHLDAAFDGDHYCALTIMARRHDGKLQARGWVFQGNVKDWYVSIENICRQFKVRKLYLEDNPDKGFTGDFLSSRGLTVSTYTEAQNKHYKISTYAYEVWNDILWDPQTEDEYMGQVTDYCEKQTPDDAPDSLASLVRAAYSKRSASRINRWLW